MNPAEPGTPGSGPRLATAKAAPVERGTAGGRRDPSTAGTGAPGAAGAPVPGPPPHGERAGRAAGRGGRRGGRRMLGERGGTGGRDGAA